MLRKITNRRESKGSVWPLLPEETVTRSPHLNIYTVVITVARLSPASPNKNLGSLARLEGTWAPTPSPGTTGKPLVKVAACGPLPGPAPPDCARDTMSHFGPKRPDQCLPGPADRDPQTPKSSLEQPPAPDSDGSPGPAQVRQPDPPEEPPHTHIAVSLGRGPSPSSLS